MTRYSHRCLSPHFNNVLQDDDNDDDTMHEIWVTLRESPLIYDSEYIIPQPTKMVEAILSMCGSGMQAWNDVMNIINGERATWLFLGTICASKEASNFSWRKASHLACAELFSSIIAAIWSIWRACRNVKCNRPMPSVVMPPIFSGDMPSRRTYFRHHVVIVLTID